MREYVGAATIAGWFGVTRSTVAKWRERYEDCPPPSVTIDGVPGWAPSSEAAWRRWHARRPGQGAGGGRRSAALADGLGGELDRFADGMATTAAGLADLRDRQAGGEHQPEDVGRAVNARQRAAAKARGQRQAGSGAG